MDSWCTLGQDGCYELVAPVVDIAPGTYTVECSAVREAGGAEQVFARRMLVSTVSEGRLRSGCYASPDQAAQVRLTLLAGDGSVYARSDLTAW